MRVAVVLEHRFLHKADGTVWTGGPFGYSFFSRYLSVFDSVRVVARISEARVSKAPDDEPGLIRAGGAGVSFFPMPYYVGPARYLLKCWRLYQVAREAVRGADAAILRVPSQIANCVAGALRQRGHPFGLEVVGDPWDTFAPGSHAHRMRPLFRWHYTRRLARQCRQARRVSYVTATALQTRYAANPEAFTTHYSSVELPEEAFVQDPRTHPRAGNAPRRPFRLVTVGSLEHFYKGPDTLIEALALCTQKGLDLQLDFVGEGQRRRELEALAARRGLGSRVRFAGQLASKDAVRQTLDQADLFVLASRQEGVPRAMIEAMARALPAVGTHAGGIPELLPGECRVPPDNPLLLAGKLHDIITSPERLDAMSFRNLTRARSYADDVLRPRREAFYRRLREETQAWRQRCRRASGASFSSVEKAI